MTKAQTIANEILSWAKPGDTFEATRTRDGKSVGGIHQWTKAADVRHEFAHTEKFRKNLERAVPKFGYSTAVAALRLAAETTVHGAEMQGGGGGYNGCPRVHFLTPEKAQEAKDAADERHLWGEQKRSALDGLKALGIEAEPERCGWVSLPATDLSQILNDAFYGRQAREAAEAAALCADAGMK